MVSLFTVLVKGKLFTTSSGRDKSTVSLFKFLGKETEQEQNRLHSSLTHKSLSLGKNTGASAQRRGHVRSRCANWKQTY